MNIRIKKITLAISCLVMLFGIIALPRVSFADITVSHLTPSITVQTENSSLHVTNTTKTTHVTGASTADSTVGNVSIIANATTSVIYPVYGFTSVSPAFTSGLSSKQRSKTPSSPVPSTNGNVPSAGAASSLPFSSSSGFGGSSGDITSAGVGLGVGVAIAMLPFTGSNWFFIAFIGNILVILMGGYLGLHSGRSPGFAL